MPAVSLGHQLHGILKVIRAPTAPGVDPATHHMTAFRFSCRALAPLTAAAAFACTTDLRDELPVGPDGGTLESQCPEGTHSTSQGQCEPCEVGTYCAPGAEPETCGIGSWDHDADPRTRCEPWTNCKAGEFVMAEGTSSRDRGCVPCDTGQFSLDVNEAACALWTACGAGQHVQLAGSAASDQVCGQCLAGTYTAEVNESMCSAWTTCTPGQYVEAEGSLASDRVCKACEPGTFSNSADATAC